METFYGPRVVTLNSEFPSWVQQTSMVYLSQTPNLDAENPALITYATHNFQGKSYRYFSNEAESVVSYDQVKSFQLKAGWYLRLRFKDQSQANFMGPVNFDLSKLTQPEDLDTLTIHYMPSHIDNFANIFTVSLYSEESLFSGQYLGIFADKVRGTPNMTSIN